MNYYFKRNKAYLQYVLINFYTVHTKNLSTESNIQNYQLYLVILSEINVV